jgi:hypothetical protein
VRPAAVVAGALLLVPVVLIAATFGALGGGQATVPVAARGAAGLAAAATQAGFDRAGLRLAVAVGLAESHGDPNASHHNPPTPGCPAGSTDRGAWQLNDCYHPEVSDACAFELACAARAAFRISGGGDWRAWTTYTSGAYQAELAAADRAIAALDDPGGCGLSAAADQARLLVVERFGITDVGGCDADLAGHVRNSDHYPDANGQAHAIDVPVGSDRALGWQVATWAAGNATAWRVKYVLFAGQVVDFRAPHPTWHACRDPASSCATEHFGHVHVSFFPDA